MKFDKDMLREMILGHKKARLKSWGETGEYIYIVEGRTISVQDWKSQFLCQEPTAAEKESGLIRICTHIDKVTAEGCREIGWHPSKEEKDSDEWVFIE